MREEVLQPSTAGHHFSETGPLPSRAVSASSDDSGSDTGAEGDFREEHLNRPAAGMSRSDSESPDTEIDVSEIDSFTRNSGEHGPVNTVSHMDTRGMPKDADIVPQETTRHRFSDAGYQQNIPNDINYGNKNMTHFSTIQITSGFLESQYLQKYTPTSEFLIDNKNSSTTVTSQVPDSLQHLIKGMEVLADPCNTTEFKPPAWLDMEKFKLGRNFGIKYFFGLAYAEMLSLMILFSFKGGLDPLVFTNKSSSPFSAFQRYLSTVVRVRSWYREDVWDPKSAAGRNMAAVRTLHRSVKERMNSQDPEQVTRQTKLNHEETCCPFLSRIHEDCSTSVAAPLAGQCPYKSVNSNLYVNQMDMSITQFGFVGLMILFPEKFGAVGATEKELDGFVHLWAGLGYLLGIEDRFNFCIGGLNECRIMSYDLLNYWAKPNLRDVGPEWEHMSRCVVKGISYYVPENSFEAAINYLFWVLDIPIPRLSVVIPWWRRILFHLQRFTFCVLVRLPGQRAFHNWLLHRRIDRAVRAPASWLQRLKARARASVPSHPASGSPALVLAK